MTPGYALASSIISCWYDTVVCLSSLFASLCLSVTKLNENDTSSSKSVWTSE